MSYVCICTKLIQYFFVKVGYAITCSFDRGIELYENSFSSKYKTRYFSFNKVNWEFLLYVPVLFLIELVDAGMFIVQENVEINCQITWGKDQLSGKPRTLHFDILWEPQYWETHWATPQILKDMALILFTNMIELVKMEMIHVIFISTFDIYFRKIIWYNS